MLYFSYGFPDRGIPKQFVTKLYGIAELMGRESIKLVFSFGFFLHILLEIGRHASLERGCARQDNSVSGLFAGDRRRRDTKVSCTIYQNKS